MRPLLVLVLAVVAVSGCSGIKPYPATTLRPESIIQLNDNGAWSWFMDERVLVDRGQLIVGSVRANGKFRDRQLSGWGNVELAVMRLADRNVTKVVLHERFEQDDHDGPGLLVLPDGRYLAMYSRHGVERKFFWRVSKAAGNPCEWGEERFTETPGSAAAAFHGDNVTYANPFRLSAEPGKLYLFHRGVGLDPNYLVSEDGAQSWRYGGHVLVGRDGYSPYLKYASNGRDTIHFVATEDHPRNYENSLYHGFLRDGQLHLSDGKVLAPLSTSTNCGINAWTFTRIFAGDSNNVAWMTDIHLDRRGHPVVLFTVQKDGAGIPRGQGGDDHRFHYARWDGKAWQQWEIAYAGKRLYAGEDDYTGLGAIDPQDTSTLVISTDADPVSGLPLISQADQKRHHELFRGRTTDKGKSWTWQPLTQNSTEDHLRPLIPIWRDKKLALVWMCGRYSANRGEWTTRVVATLLDRN